MREVSAPLFQGHVIECPLHTGRVTGPGESEAVHFSEAPGRVYLTARAALRSGRRATPTQPTLTLLVEDSADGDSWATLESFELAGNDPQNATVEPRAYMRLRWTLDDGHWDASVDAVAIAAAASENGGSSSPVTTHTVELTAAQIRDSFANGGIELAPAPGEGKAIIDASCLLIFSSDFEPFTGSFHVVMEITTDATLTSGAFSVTDNQILEALKGAGGGGDIVGVWFGGSLGDSWSGPLSQLDNAPLYFGIKVAAAMGGAGSIAVVSAITTIDLPT